MSIFTGAAVAIITPFCEDGSINYDELGKIIDDQIANGTDAIVSAEQQERPLHFLMRNILMPLHLPASIQPAEFR